MDLLDQLRQGVRTHSAAETQQWGRALAAVLPPDATLALHGDLGVGKTTFVQGLAQGLGVRETVTSPTFNLFTVYRGAERTLLHLDAYRLESERQVDALMLEDFLVSPYCLAIEWPEKIADWLPAPAWHVELGITPEQTHTLRLLPPTP